MTQLSRIRLVNWHFFGDTTVDIGPMTLLAGDNGSGKSTIIDAIQYALVARVQRIRFNAAATDRRTARTLESYTRAKVGADALDYLRGDCLSHVILEFRSDNRFSCAGIMVESFRDGDPREHPWILSDTRLSDVLVYEEERFLQPRHFREAIKRAGGKVFTSKREYNNNLTHLLGVHRRGHEFNPYFEALIRSVGFTPLNSVHDFVCDYILEERIVDVGAMKENLLNYRAAEREAAAMEERILLLEAVAEKRDSLVLVQAQIARQEYLRFRLLVEQERTALTETEEEQRREEEELRRLIGTLEEVEERRRRLGGQRDELRISLARDETRQAYERLRRDREDLIVRKGEQERRVARMDQLNGRINHLLERTGPVTDEVPATVAREAQEQNLAVAQKRIEVDDLKGRLVTLQGERAELKRGLLRYPPEVERLRAALAAEGIESHVFAELLEVTDETLQERIESWLGLDRFALLVERVHFRRAVEIYDGLEPEIALVPIPNLAAVTGEEIRAGSLAEAVTAANPDARRLTAALLGDVVRVEREHLTSQRFAVTESVMHHFDGRVRRPSQTDRTRWYLGRRALERRVEQIQEEIGVLETAAAEADSLLERLRERLRALEEAGRLLIALEELTDAPVRLESLSAELAETERRLSEIDTTGFDALQRQLDVVETMLRDVEESAGEAREAKGSRTARLVTLKEKRRNHAAELERHGLALQGFLDQEPERKEEFEAYYRDRMRNEGSRPDYGGIIRRYDASFRGLKTREENARKALLAAKRAYTQTYNAMMELDEDESRDYLDLLDRFKRTELPEYRERIEHARKEAERQFQEHFVARLNEYLMEAEESFKEINYILERISFGRDSYRFTINRRPDKSDLMHAIATAAEVQEVEDTLFASLKSDEERRSVEAVFEKILTNELDSPEVQEICDYRQYFIYDIRIRDNERVDNNTGKPLESFLSKVLREKSGGETQTPYYVAIAASFFRFYQDNPEAIRLVLFDEAFNKMDESRIGRMLDFFRELNMQVLTAVPTDKIETVAPHTDVTNLVMRRNYTAFIRRYEQLPE